MEGRSKVVRAKQVGISVAFLGLIYLSYMRAEFVQAKVPYLTSFLRVLPSELLLCWYWLLFFIYFSVWRSKRADDLVVKAFFWSYWIAIIGSDLALLWFDDVPATKIIPYLLHEVKRSGGPVFFSWIAYVLFHWAAFNAISYIYGYLYNEPVPNEVFKRGKRLISLDEARHIANNKKEPDSAGVKFGWLQVPDSQATTHFAVVGTTGSGKTILLRELMNSVFPRIEAGKDSRALVYDAKRDMLPILAGLGLKAEVITLHPFDKRGVAWDMAKDITSPASADQTATILIPNEKNSSNPFFTDAARALMTGVLTVFIKKCPDRWTFRDVIVALKSATRLKDVLLECEETRDLVEQYFSNEKTANDVISTIATKIQRYQYIAAAWEKAEKKVSLKDWIKKEYILVLGNDEETRSAVDALNQVIFKRATELILNQSESFTRRTWILLDELKEAGELPGLTSLLSKGRSKGACVVIGFQDIEGLSAAMKDTRVAHETVGLCANRAFLRLDSAETARWASSQFGDQEIEERKISTTSGTSIQKTDDVLKSSNSTSNSSSESWISTKRQTVMPAELLDLPPVEKTGSLHGYYIVPSVGSYYANIRMSGEDSILSSMKALDDNTPGYLERPKDDQFLRLWDDKDLERLGLKSLSGEEVDMKRQTLSDNSVEPGRDADPLEMIKRN